MFRTNGVTSDSMKYSVTTPRPRCIMVECSYVFFLGPREQKRFSRVFLCFVFRFTWFNGESSLFLLPWIQRDLRQDDKWMYSIFFCNHFLLKKRRKNVIPSGSGELFLQPNWSDIPLKTRRIRGNWTNRCCPVDYSLHKNSVERETESQT